MHAGRGQTQQGTVFGALRNSRRSCQTFCGFLFPLPGNCHRRRVEAHDSIALRIKTTPRTRRDAASRLLPQQAQIAPLTPPSRTLSIRVCEFLFWTPAAAEKGGGPASILQAANGRSAGACRAKTDPAKSVLLLLVVVVVGDENVISSSGSGSRWLPPRYRPISISPNTARDSSSRRERQKRLSITAPLTPLRRCHASVPWGGKAWSVGDRTDDTRRARAKTGWPYRQRADRGTSVALFERPGPQLKIVGDSGHGSLRGPSSLFLRPGACLVRGSPARIADIITSLRARGGHGSKVLFSFMISQRATRSTSPAMENAAACTCHLSAAG